MKYRGEMNDFMLSRTMMIMIVMMIMMMMMIIIIIIITHFSEYFRSTHSF